MDKKNTTPKPYNKDKNCNEAATAPYNFVSLPKHSLCSDFQDVLEHMEVVLDDLEQEKIEEAYKIFLASKEKISGYIDIEMETLTPTFVNGGDGAPFKLGDEYVIPGSSIRGMLKNIFKIVSLGTMHKEDYCDRNLFFRKIMAPNSEYAWADALCKKYKKALNLDNGSSVKKGILIEVEDENRYYIVPKVGVDGTGPDWDNRKKVDVSQYRLDNTRQEGKDLLKKMRKPSETYFDGAPSDIKTLVTCYYVPDEQCIRYFGHCKRFRVPYDNSIGKVVARSVKEETIDYADVVFGKSPYFASRVFFDDAWPENNIKPMPKFQAHPLLQPNPTSFQLYLKNEIGEKLAHWDSENAEIRGYKLYWHQNDKTTATAEARSEEKELDKGKDESKKQCQLMRPIPSNTKFTSRIRFKNLHPEELGALVVTLDINAPDKNIAFKLGQGKSIGLGSIKLSRYELYIEKDNAYRSFLSGNTMANIYQSEDSSIYKKNFKESIPDNLQSEWTQIMKELTTILDFDNTKLPSWGKSTCLMTGKYVRDKKTEKLRFKIADGFKDRRVLPTIEGVLNHAKNDN